MEVTQNANIQALTRINTCMSIRSRPPNCPRLFTMRTLLD